MRKGHGRLEQRRTEFSGTVPAGLCEATFSFLERERERYRIELEMFSDASNTAGGAPVKEPNLRAHEMWSESE